jgi:hypothetical protein
MDEIVKAAMAKWPNVPHCYGWLLLDARGTWRMRDERAQALHLKGDPIRNTTLNQFINRNYACDENGNWYFQNGPQKVYIDLETTPYIAHFLPEQGWILHTKKPLTDINNIYINQEGNIFFQNETLLAQVDDRDLNYAIGFIEKNGATINEEDLFDLMSAEENDIATKDEWTFNLGNQQRPISIQKAELSKLMKQRNYQQEPRK